MTRALDGITVVSLEQAVAAPFATRQLADLGARVIKVERPGSGDFARRYDETVLGQSSYFVWLNRSKESLTLDLKKPVAVEVLHRLLSTADVFVQNLAPGATDRLGLGAKSLIDQYPQLIVCDVSGYGSTGSWAGRKAYDMLVQSEVGLISLTGSEEAAAKVGISIADIAAGMYAYSGILTALLQRTTTGRGAHLEVSLFDALAEWMGQPVHYTDYGGLQPRRVGTQHATIAPYGPFQCKDGSVVIIGIQNDPEWREFCADFLRRPEIADDPRFDRNSARVANRQALNMIIGTRFAELDPASVLSQLAELGVAYARQNTVHDLIDHPVLGERDRWRTVETPAGPVRALLPPAILAGSEPRMDPVPAIGAHTRAILVELGYGEDEIRAMRKTETL